MKRKRFRRGAPVLFRLLGPHRDLARDLGLTGFVRCRAWRLVGRWVALDAKHRVHGVLGVSTEGTIWCRGWSGEGARALRAAAVME